MKLRTFENQPCLKCGSIDYVHVPGNINEIAGWECANCGREFIPDNDNLKIDIESLPFSLRETLLIEE